MNKLVLGSILVMFIAIIGGWLLYRATMPEENTTELEKAAENQNKQDGLFFQMQPKSLPPAEDRSAGDIFTSPVPNSPTSQENVPASSGAGNQPSSIMAPTATVAIDDTGFIPATLSVQAGTYVIFINNGQAMHWPASDNHPTHENLPGFDAGRGLATGDEYSFTFSKVGTWTYHDHLNPGLKGAVTVK